ACLGVVPALNWLGGPNAVLFAALVMAAAALAWDSMEPARPWRKRAWLAIAVLAALIAANSSGLLFDVVYAKGWRQDMKLRLFSKWNALSRVEVKQVGDSKYVVIDSDATTAIMNVDAHQWHGTVWQHNLMAAAPAVTNVLRPHGSYAIIGPGGGVDVLRAVANGSTRVVGIEINPIIANTIMRGRFADYAYHLYEIPEVTIHVSDGRSWLRASHEQFDVVQMTLVDTWASTAAGAFALSENNLYTREAFREYFDHLKPDGMLAITRWEFRRPREALRVVAEAMDALHAIGVARPEGNFIVVSDGKLDEDGRPVTVLVRKTPFSAEEEAAVERHLGENPNLALLYSPRHREPNPFADLIRSNDPRGFAATYAYDVTPVDDNNPFFFFTLKTRDMLRDVMAGRGRGMDWRINLGVVVLGILLLISVAAVLVFLVLPLALSREGARSSVGGVSLLYFVAIGLGYIMAEITFIQRFVLFLGHPTYALTVVVFLMLLSSGAGSLAGRRWKIEGTRLLLVIAAVAAVLMADRIALPALLGSEVGLPFAVRLLISGLLLAPLGFCMGMPFPAGLAALSARAERRRRRESSPGGSEGSGIEWAWAMNAASSVLGSVVAMVVAIHFGLNATLLGAAAAYGLAAVVAAAALSPVPAEARRS
ncbi:MAG TPA: hypothetical protein VE998_08740, partial [Terriglobales bacterium]|nr:hypothetical protein [Terriglobales bacterium]